ncbi:MAG TPA: glycosyltransferase family 2 protein [Chloroflexota bacterium]
MSGWIRLITWLGAAHVGLWWLLAVRRAVAARGRREEPCNGTVAAVSILVPAWRERGTVERCVRALQAVRQPSWEAVIVAGGPDGTYEAALRATAGDPRFRVLRQEPRGKNAALNQGIGAARHDVLVMLDADSVVSPDWLAHLVAPLAAGAGVVVGNYFPVRRTWISTVEQMEKVHAYGIARSRAVQGSGSVAVWRHTLDRIGGLPEDVLAGVDWDLGARAAAVGERIVFAREARLFTDRPATLSELWKNEVRWRRAHLALLWRHRATLLRHPLQAAAGLAFYALSALLVLGALASLVLAVARPPTRSVVRRLWAVVLGWMLGRRATLGVEVALYTKDPGWLRAAWAPLALLPVSVAGAVAAMVSPTRVTAHFKGPRPSAQA